MKHHPPVPIITCNDQLTASVIAAAVVRHYGTDFKVTTLHRVNVEVNRQEFTVCVARRVGGRITQVYLNILLAFARGANAVVENMIQAPR